MKILVMSDTHENCALAFRAIDMASPIDAVVHLGDFCKDAELLSHALDVPLIRVAGNCDFGSDAAREYVWEHAGKRLLLLHGDRYGVKSGLSRLEKHAVEIGVDAVLYGHTHCADVTTRSGILFINPGALSLASTNKTFAIVEIGPFGVSAILHEIPSP